jgi:hypothetical protein
MEAGLDGAIDELLDPDDEEASDRHENTPAD